MTSTPRPGEASDDPIGDAIAREQTAHEAAPTTDPIDDPGDPGENRPDTPPVKVEPTE